MTTASNGLLQPLLRQVELIFFLRLLGRWHVEALHSFPGRQGLFNATAKVGKNYRNERNGFALSDRKVKAK
jgi:hypothetical protein